MKNRFEKVIETLVLESGSLKDIASSTGCELYNFFQGADLSEVDLSNQDLTGLNFDRASLRGANLDGIQYNTGSFNRATLDQKYEEKKDKFQFDLQEISIFSKLLRFSARFRPNYIDEIRNELKITFEEIADRSRVSTQTLRKARHGLATTTHTMVSMTNGILSLITEYAPQKSHLLRPCLEIRRFAYNGGKKWYSWEEFLPLANFSISVREAYFSYPGHENESHYFAPGIFRVENYYDFWLRFEGEDSRQFLKEFWDVYQIFYEDHAPDHAAEDANDDDLA